VLIGDLVTKGVVGELTGCSRRSRVRLLLREDNADARLRPLGESVGAVSAADLERTRTKQQAVAAELERLERAAIVPGEIINEALASMGAAPISAATTLAQLLRRPDLTYEMLATIDAKRPQLAPIVRNLVEVEIKYEGYIRRQQDAVERFRRMDDAAIPADLDYAKVNGLSHEAQEKLSTVRPASMGQAGRIPGLTPAALSLLAVHLRRFGRPGAAREAS
jgi:tRNA uridine 5-carboxymethylaminomethyl modification enzyme